MSENTEHGCAVFKTAACFSALMKAECECYAMIVHRISTAFPCLCIIQANSDPEIEKCFLSLKTFIEQDSKCTVKCCSLCA